MTRTELLRGFHLADKTVLPAEGRIESARGTVRIEPRVMDLLVYLAASAGEVVNRDAIIKDVWRGTLVTDDVISRSIYLIRRALAEPGSEETPSVIQTIPKRGYRLVAPVAPLTPEPRSETAVLPANSAPPEPAIPTVAPLPAGRRRVTWLAALAAIVIVLSIWLVSRDREVARTPVAMQGFMVLPFSTVGTGAGALSDDVRDQLGSIQDLRVIGRRSALHAQTSHASYAEIGRTLNVTAILEGDVETAGNDVDVRLRLVNAVNGALIYQKTYHAPFADTPSLPVRVARDTAQALRLTLPAGGLQVSARLPQADAYRLFLQGRYYASLNSPGGYQQAHDYLAQATKLDPTFERAFIALAATDMLMVDFGGRTPSEAETDADVSLARAQALNPSSPELLAVRGLVALYNRRYAEASDTLRQATSLRPSYGQAYLWLGRVFLAQREMRRAGSAFARAYDLDPEWPIAALNLGLVEDAEGQYEAAERVLGRAIASGQPPNANLQWAFAHVEMQQGKYELAEQAYRKAIELGAEYAALYAQFAMLHAEMGNLDDATALIAHGRGLDEHDPTLWAARAMVAVLSSDAGNLLQISSAEGDTAPPWQALAQAKVLLWRGDAKAAVRVYENAQVETRLSGHELTGELELLGGPAVFADMACAYRMIGDTGHAQHNAELAEQILSADRERGINPVGYDYLLASIAALRNDESQSVSLLKFAAARGWRDYEWLKRDPHFRLLANRAKVLAVLNSEAAKTVDAVH